MATRTISAASTCQTPPTFGSLSGRPARSLSKSFDTFLCVMIVQFLVDDCFWDFAQCSHNDPLHCCQERFKNCCMYITNSLPPPPLETTTTTTTTVPPTTTQPPTLIGCVWRFNGCVQDKYNRGQSDESICHQRFDDCKMIVMGNMMAMMDNSVDELPMPFMSVEAATMSPPSHESKPTLSKVSAMMIELVIGVTLFFFSSVPEWLFPLHIRAVPAKLCPMQHCSNGTLTLWQ